MNNALFIWYQKPAAIPNGGDHCSMRNYELCCKVLGAHVQSLYLHEGGKNLKYMLLAPFFFPFGYYYGLTQSRVKKIVAMAHDYDCIFVDRSLFGIVARELKMSGYKGRIVVHFHNVEKVYFDEAKLPKWFPFRNIIVRCAEKNDQWSMQYADKVIALNARDESVLFKMYNRHADLLLPIALPDRFQSVPDRTVMPSKPLCLTIGAYFGPNNAGILWFAKNVLPHVDAIYMVVGKDMHRLKEEHPDELRDVEVISNAPSLQPYIEKADLMILPIFAGSGMKVKTCESLMNGKYILGTTEAFEGYEGDYDQIGGRCDTAEQFIEKIHYYSEQGLGRFNNYSRQLFLTNYAYDAVATKFAQVIFDKE